MFEKNNLCQFNKRNEKYKLTKFKKNIFMYRLLIQLAYEQDYAGGLIQFIKLIYLQLEVNSNKGFNFMLLKELHEHYKNWSLFARELGFGFTSYQKWKRKGYIPYATQCVIEKKTGGLFKAKIEDAQAKETQ